MIPVLVTAFLLSDISAVDSYASQKKNSYGVFPGLNRDKMEKLYSYELVVIDASGYTKRDIAKLHKRGVKVYSYLNIGSIETFRSYYKKFKKYTLSVYENWPDERWIDVSKKEWQDYVVKTIAKKLHAKGIDGFFIDNADIYENYRTTKIYNGVKKILTELKKTYRKDIIVNGGSEFVEKAISKGEKISRMFNGVNQENVFTTIRFSTGKFFVQGKAETDFYKKYLSKCKKKRLKIYVTEYALPKASIRKKIEKYCKKHKYKYYISPNLNLV